MIRKKDGRHSDTLAAVSIFTGHFVTTDLVLVELANSLSLPPNRFDDHFRQAGFETPLLAELK